MRGCDRTVRLGNRGGGMGAKYGGDRGAMGGRVEDLMFGSDQPVEGCLWLMEQRDGPVARSDALVVRCSCSMDPSNGPEGESDGLEGQSSRFMHLRDEPEGASNTLIGLGSCLVERLTG